MGSKRTQPRENTAGWVCFFWRPFFFAIFFFLKKCFCVQLGAVVDAWGDLCEHRVLNGHTVVDRSEDAFAEVAAMLETIQLYKTYFRNSFPVLPDVNSKVVHVPLSPIAKRIKVEPPPNMDDSLLASKVGAVLSPTQGQSLASVATQCDIGSEKDVLGVLQSMIWAGLCYEKGSLFFAL